MEPSFIYPLGTLEQNAWHTRENGIFFRFRHCVVCDDHQVIKVSITETRGGSMLRDGSGNREGAERVRCSETEAGTGGQARISAPSRFPLPSLGIEPPRVSRPARRALGRDTFTRHVCPRSTPGADRGSLQLSFSDPHLAHGALTWSPLPTLNYT